MSTKPRLDSLPRALIALILAHAAVDDRARAACACHALREAAEDCCDVLDMKELATRSGDGWSMYWNAVRAMIWKRRGESIRELRLGDAFDDSDEVLWDSDGNSQPFSTLIPLESALSVAQHCPNAAVTEFSVYIDSRDANEQFGTQALPQIWKALSNLPGPFGAVVSTTPPNGKFDWILPHGLVALCFTTYDAENVTDELWAAMEEGLVANTSLESFEICDSYLGQSAVDRFAVILNRNTTLRTLQFTIDFDAGFDFRRLADAVRANKSLRLLKLITVGRTYTNLFPTDLFTAATRGNPAVTVELEFNGECDGKCSLECVAQIRNGLVSWGCGQVGSFWD